MGGAGGDAAMHFSIAIVLAQAGHKKVQFQVMMKLG
jgi:hypothetical protein